MTKKSPEPQSHFSARTKRLNRLASKLEQSMQKEDRLRDAIAKLQAEADAVSKLFDASKGNRKSTRKP